MLYCKSMGDFPNTAFMFYILVFFVAFITSMNALFVQYAMPLILQQIYVKASLQMLQYTLNFSPIKRQDTPQFLP